MAFGELLLTHPDPTEAHGGKMPKLWEAPEFCEEEEHIFANFRKVIEGISILTVTLYDFRSSGKPFDPCFLHCMWSNSFCGRSYGISHHFSLAAADLPKALPHVAKIA